MANGMLDMFTERPVEDDWATCDLTLAGWSWARLRYEVYEAPRSESGVRLVHYDAALISRTHGRSDFMRRFGWAAAFDRERHLIGCGLSTLADVAADSAVHSVGGIPQLVKVLRALRRRDRRKGCGCRAAPWPG